MPQPEHPARRVRPHGPQRRGGSTRPASTRKGGERRPYQAAPTSTRARPGFISSRSHSRGSATSQPTPATVWTAGQSPIDLDTTWPTPIVEKIVTSFSNPGARVALLPWPTHSADRQPGAVGPHNEEVSGALAAVANVDRNPRVVHIAAEDYFTGSASRPFWADLIGDSTQAPTSVTTSSPSAPDSTVLDDADAGTGDTELIITSLRPEHGGDRTSDVVALAAARLLRVGGVLAVLTHCDWSAGTLIDPTGAVVAAAQNADLLYLQHIVALHMPVRDGRLATEPLADATEPLTDAADSAAERREPAAHRRIHSDVLVFAQPRTPEPPAMSHLEHAMATGVLR